MRQYIRVKMGVTNAGLQEILTWIRGGVAVAPTHMATGTDNTPFDEEDTALNTEVGRYTIASTTNIDPDTVTFTVVVNAAQLNGNTFKEEGLLNASVAGDLFARFTHANIVKTTSIEVEYQITIKLVN